MFVVRCPRFVLVTIQLGLQVQVGRDVSAVKDDVSAVKDSFYAVKDGVDLSLASSTFSRVATHVHRCAPLCCVNQLSMLCCVNRMLRVQASERGGSTRFSTYSTIETHVIGSCAVAEYLHTFRPSPTVVGLFPFLQRSIAEATSESVAESRRVKRQRKLDQVEISEEYLSITDELLGKGGFGEVYLADYNGHNAAAKV